LKLDLPGQKQTTLGKKMMYGITVHNAGQMPLTKKADTIKARRNTRKRGKIWKQNQQ
jgi:hypothetical protein